MFQMITANFRAVSTVAAAAHVYACGIRVYDWHTGLFFLFSAHFSSFLMVKKIRKSEKGAKSFGSCTVLNGMAFYGLTNVLSNLPELLRVSFCLTIVTLELEGITKKNGLGLLRISWAKGTKVLAKVFYDILLCPCFADRVAAGHRETSLTG